VAGQERSLSPRVSRYIKSCDRAKGPKTSQEIVKGNPRRYFKPELCEVCADESEVGKPIVGNRTGIFNKLGRTTRPHTLLHKLLHAVLLFPSRAPRSFPFFFFSKKPNFSPSFSHPFPPECVTLGVTRVERTNHHVHPRVTDRRGPRCPFQCRGLDMSCKPSFVSPKVTVQRPSQSIYFISPPNSNNSDSSQSATPPRRPTLSATFPPPTSAMPSDFPPDLPPDDIPKSPLLAYSLTPDIDDVCETFTGTVQDSRNPPARARGVSAPAAATSNQPPGPPNSFSELPPSQLSGCEAPLSPSAPSSSVSSHAISRFWLLSTNDPSIRSVPLTRITFRNSLLHASYGQLYPLQVKGMGTRRACRCLATLCCASE
jgi:hypothetical protein